MVLLDQKHYLRDSKKKKKNFMENKFSKKIPSQDGKDDFRWFKCDTGLRKTALTFISQEQTIETKACKKIKALVKQYQVCLCSQEKKTVQHLLAGHKRTGRTECKRMHDKAMKLAAVKWKSDNSLIIPDGLQ